MQILGTQVSFHLLICVYNNSIFNYPLIDDLLTQHIVDRHFSWNVFVAFYADDCLRLSFKQLAPFILQLWSPFYFCHFQG